MNFRLVNFLFLLILKEGVPSIFTRYLYNELAERVERLLVTFNSLALQRMNSR